ncbi:unnamed protein product, partial [Ectocarpus sp. 12 AP-2014]
LNYRKAIEDEKTSLTLILNDDAEEMLHDYVQNLIIKQQNLPNVLKEYNSKMQINIYKLIVVLHLMTNCPESSFQNHITVETVDLAICVNEFYFTNFKMITSSSVNAVNEKTFRNELFKQAINNGASQKDIIAITGLSKGQVSKIWNKHMNETGRKLETGNLL